MQSIILSPNVSVSQMKEEQVINTRNQSQGEGVCVCARVPRLKVIVLELARAGETQGTGA